MRASLRALPRPRSDCARRSTNEPAPRNRNPVLLPGSRGLRAPVAAGRAKPLDGLSRAMAQPTAPRQAQALAAASSGLRPAWQKRRRKAPTKRLPGGLPGERTPQRGLPGQELPETGPLPRQRRQKRLPQGERPAQGLPEQGPAPRTLAQKELQPRQRRQEQLPWRRLTAPRPETALPGHSGRRRAGETAANPGAACAGGGRNRYCAPAAPEGAGCPPF